MYACACTRKPIPFIPDPRTSRCRTAQTSGARRGQRHVDGHHGELDEGAEHVRGAAVPVVVQIRKRELGDGAREHRPRVLLPCLLFVAQEPENVYTELSLPAHANAYTLSNVKCGTAVAFSISAINRVGHGTQSRPFSAKTLHGNTPVAPAQAEVSSAAGVTAIFDSRENLPPTPPR